MIALKAALYTHGNKLELIQQALAAYHPQLTYEFGKTNCPYCNGIAEKKLISFTTINNVTVTNVPGTQCHDPNCGKQSFDLKVVAEIERTTMDYEEGTILTLDELVSD